LKPLQAIDR